MATKSSIPFYYRALAILGIMAVGCSSSTKHAEELESALNCNMTIEEVEALANDKLKELDLPASWKTHFIERGDSILSLGFRHGRLKLVQVSWNELPTKVASYQIVDLCGDAPKELNAVYRLPAN